MQHFGDEVAILVERYDREEIGGTLVRVHQDVDGGPTASRIYELLRESSTNADEDCERCFDAIAVITILPYPQLNYDKSRLAMSVGGERQVSKIDATHWLRFARTLGLKPEYAVHRLRELSVRIPDAVEALKEQINPDDYMRSLVTRLGDSVVDHVRRCVYP